MPRPSLSRRKLSLFAVALALIGVIVPADTAGAAPHDGTAPPIVATRDGVLAGQTHNGADEFLKVPYAAPPVGALRFRSPQPPARWTGVRDATRQGPACIQFSPFGLVDPNNVSEDCLYLDVYRPQNATPGSHLPVIVWIHGGGFTQGTGTQFGGDSLVTQNNAILVSINYRLGQLGYLALPQLDPENPLGSGTFGLQDQVAALAWTRANIAAFGGDPDNVTVDGQSAGGFSICDLLASPFAASLFQRAVIQSGPCTVPSSFYATVPQAESAGTAYAAKVGCSDPATVVACLRAATPAALVAANSQFISSSAPIGTPLVPRLPAEAIASGVWNKVPVMIGATRWEGRFFIALEFGNLTADQYVAQVNALYGPAAPQVLAHYPLSAYQSPYFALSAVYTDSVFSCNTLASARLFSTQTPTFLYEFDDPNSPTLRGAQVPGLDMSNGHTAELAYIFDYTMEGGTLTPTQIALGVQMKHYWSAFAATGAPEVLGQPAWPPFIFGDAALTLRPDGSTVTTGFAAEHQCAFWASLTAPAP